MRTGLYLATGLVTAALAMGCGDDSGSTGNNNGNDNANENTIECGNGEEEGTEECDDGSANSDTVPNACRSDCTLPACGDSVADDAQGEQCDEGASNSDTEPDACRTDCLLPTCGDGVIDTGSGETCDDGNTAAGDGCGPSCVLESCGDGILDTGEDCDNGAANSDTEPDACRTNCTDAHCGDDVVDTNEICDDGNNTPGDGCAGDCLSDESCGNGLQELTEQCDDGNLASRDGCSSGCTLETLDWQQLTGGSAPLARCGHALAYDRSRHRVVMHGGHDPVNKVVLGDTIELGSGWWSPVTPNPDIAFGRFWTGMVYDTMRGAVHLFGGWNNHGGIFPQNDDNNHYNGQAWTAVTYTPNPSERWGHAMTYDEARGVAVLFGGRNVLQDEPGIFESDSSSPSPTWSSVITTGSGPDERSYHAMAYDAANQEVVLQGGRHWSVQRDETWLYNGATSSWTDVTPSAGSPDPGARWFHSMVYDPGRQRIVLFGGLDTNGVLGDTWEWDGSAWTETTPLSSPTARQAHAMTYDYRRRGILLFGGLDDQNECDAAQSNALGDTWIYRYNSAWPDEVCDNTTDDDADGLVDCADPDCEGLPCATGTCSGSVCQ